MSSDNAQPQRSTSILPSLPNISTTISSILLTSTSPAAATDNDKSSNVRQNAASPITLASFLPNTPNMMTSWFRKPTSTKSTAASPTGEDEADLTAQIDRSDAQSQSDTNADAAAVCKKRKRQTKPKTSYTLCHAPPRSGQRHKIKVRARPLLQLHKQESRSRPRPAFELLPSAIFSPRLVKAIAKFSTSKLGMHPTDLAVVRAEDYHRHESSPDQDDETHDILAMICGAAKGTNGRARICLEGGVEWEAYQLSSGSYECTTIDGHGLKRTVRWVLKRNAKGGVTSPTVSSPTGALSPTASIVDATESKKFMFSTISANTRRHPVIGSLTMDSLDISDIYTIPAPSGSVDIGVPSLDRRESESSTESIEDTVTTTDELRNLITATAIFVAVAEGWCTNYRSEDSLSRSLSAKSASPVKSANPRHQRTSSFDTDKGRSASLRTALRSPMIRRGSSVTEETNSCNSSVFEASIAPIPEHKSTPRRRRADTTATVIVHGGSQWRPAYDDETEDEIEPEDVKSTKGSPDLDYNRRASVQTLDCALSSAGDAEAAREKKFSTASTVVGSDHAYKEKEKHVGAYQAKTKKGGVMSRLLCGMV